MRTSRILATTLWIGALLPAPHISAQPTLTTLATVAGQIYGGLLLGPNGEIYGPTVYGGIGYGSIFELTPPASPGGPWTQTTLYSFQLTDGQLKDGAYPQWPLLMDRAGVLYSTAGGVVFALAPPKAPGGTWTERVLHYFTDQNGDGRSPLGLAFGPNGQLYGATNRGGAFNLGIVFELTPHSGPDGARTETVIYSFGSQSGDGGYPGGPLLVDKHGNLFGAAGGNGVTTPGTVFELSPPTVTGGNWTETILYSFAPGDGPGAELAMDSRGNLYSTTVAGGTVYCAGLGGCGSVYELTPPASPGLAWTETTLYSFTAQNGDGYLPEGGVIIARNGALFGTTAYGGTLPAYGTFFWLTPPTATGEPWTETVLPIGTPNDTPFARLIFGPNNTIYGAGVDSVFQVTPSR